MAVGAAGLLLQKAKSDNCPVSASYRCFLPVPKSSTDGMENSMRFFLLSQSSPLELLSWELEAWGKRL
jgi:hypothetical protein